VQKADLDPRISLRASELERIVEKVAEDLLQQGSVGPARWQITHRHLDLPALVHLAKLVDDLFDQ